jgi:hypothetical protein
MRILLFCALALVLVVLAGWRCSDHRADRMEMAHLLALQPKVPMLFDYAMIANLPEPAQRYFRFTIAQGTPLLPVAKLSMTGLFSLGDKDQPNYMKMQAHQVLAPPHGFVWKMRAQSGHLRVSGSDSSGWLRFWIGGIMPVARVGTSKNLTRSAYGRSVAEAVFWAPAALLPGPDVVWDKVDVDTAKVSVRHAGNEQSVQITLASDGQPLSVSFVRWSNANPEKKYREQPFGGYLSKFKKVQGYQIPTHVEAGNFFGTDAYFPFFIADVTEISFPKSP